MTYETIEVHIPELPPSPNQIVRWHWARKAKVFKRLRIMTAYAASKFRPKRPYEKVELSIIRASSRPMDADNAIASCKPLIDGLRDANIIVDDNPNVITKIHYQWIKAKPKAGFIKLVIEPVKEEL